MTQKASHQTAEERLVKTSAKDVFRRLWPSLRPYRFQFLAGVILILGTTAIEIFFPILVGRAVDAVTQANPSKNILIRLAALYAGLVVLKAVMDTAQAFVIQASGQKVTHELRLFLFAHICGLPVPYFDRNPTGRLLTRVVNDIKSLSELFTASISVLALDCLVILGTILAMFYLHWKLALVTLVSFPLVIFTIRYYGVKLALAYRKVRLKLAEMNAFLGENIGAIATIQRLSAEESRLARFEKIVEEHRLAQMESLKVFALVQPVANSLNGFSMAALLIGGGYWVIQGSLSVGVMVAFLGYIRNLFQPIRDLVEKYNTFLSSMVSAERIVGILDESSETVDEKAARIVHREPVPNRQGISIDFENVTFRYPTRESNAVESVTFSIPARGSLAIVGATGSGKSTLIRLLLRFYEPTSGRILLGGEPATDWSRDALRRDIGVVHQEIYLFKGTLRNNLTLGREDLPDKLLILRCEQAQLWPLIKDRGGLDMPVLEGGTNFSLGERQLISMARVLIMDCPLLVLDEATSSIDRGIEKRLMLGLHEVLKSRTSIVIAHRLSTIRECDEIVVMEDGKLVERGAFYPLLQQRGRFFDFYQIHERLHEPSAHSP